MFGGFLIWHGNLQLIDLLAVIGKYCFMILSFYYIFLHVLTTNLPLNP